MSHRRRAPGEQGLCADADLGLGEYWRRRTGLEIATAVILPLPMFGSVFLAYKLRAAFDWNTFKRLGASRAVARAHRTRLAFAVVLQLAIFFLLVLGALWLNELICNDFSDPTFALVTRDGTVMSGGNQGKNSSQHASIAVMALFVAAVPVWLWLGLSASALGSRVRMAVFLLSSLLAIVLGIFVAFVDSARLYRDVAATWPFLLALGVISAVLVLLASGLGTYILFTFRSDASVRERTACNDQRAASPIDEKVLDDDARSFDDVKYERDVVVDFPVAVERVSFDMVPRAPPTRVLLAPAARPQSDVTDSTADFPRSPDLSSPELPALELTSPEIGSLTPPRRPWATPRLSIVTVSSNGWEQRLAQPGVLPPQWLPRPSHWSDTTSGRS